MRVVYGIRAVVLAVLFGVGAARAQDVAIYDEAFRNGFVGDYSYGGVPANFDFASTAQAHSGTLSVAFTGNGFNAVAFANTVTSYPTAQYPVLKFWVHGGSGSGQQLEIFLYSNRDGAAEASAPLNGFITGGSIAAGQWREVTVPLTQPPLNFTGSLQRIDLQNQIDGALQPTLYLDDVALIAAASGSDPIFANGFESSTLPPPPNGLVIERDVTVDSMVSDRFSWRDSANLPRVAVLAHNDGQTGPGGSRGGELRELRYETGAGTRIVRAPGSGAGGFGYVVSHRAEGTTGIPGDDSPLGHGFPGSFQRVFEGRHHAIFRFTQSYPRYSRTGAVPPNTLYNVPVTVDWVFATGRDHPLWAITWDLAAASVPADALEDDSRAPYGELLFDGAASAGAHSVIAGVGWGDRYKFASTTNPVTYNSAWTWNTANSIPYVKLWTTAVDATMGTVLTQTITQQDAGGYYGTNRWNTTSASGNACTVAIGGVNTLMPCDFNWPYQSINYSLNPFTPASPTNNTRLAWGTNFGFLGQSSYYVHGSAYYGGPLPNVSASGWPRKSYSTYVVLGKHTLDPVGAQVTQVEAIQSLTLTAAQGSVATSGPAGIARPDTITYAPAGYDPVYSTLAFNASSNRLDANIAVGAGTLRKPLVILRNFSGGYPGTVRFNNVSLTVDVDYFPSLRSSANELWITLNRDLVGASNRLEVLP